MDPVNFFVSYNRADKAWAEWIAWILEESKYTSVLQAWDFRPGNNWVLQMQEATSEADRTIAVLSPDFLRSDYTQPEWAAAFARDPKGKDARLVPVRVRDCRPTGLLAQITYIDLVGFDEEGARSSLLAGVREERIKPSSPVPFPGGDWKPEDKPRYPGSGQQSPAGDLSPESKMVVFEEVFQFARREMSKTEYSAELFARSWLESSSGRDFALFRKWYFLARNEMHKTEYSAEHFALEMMKKDL